MLLFWLFVPGVGRHGRGQRSRPGRTSETRRDSAELRAWAKEHGIEISGRGRTLSVVTEQYEAAAAGR